MFKNEPLTDFSVARERQAMTLALTALDAEVSKKTLICTPLINGEAIKTKEFEMSVDPSDHSILGEAFYAGEEQAFSALKYAKEATKTWGNLGHTARAAILMRAAQIMRDRKHRISSLIIRESGKPWREADADTAEAIDFCEYYADEMIRLANPRRTMEVAGEDDFYFYQPRGVALVIAPWNFPFAIACGMAVAALVAGNPTLLKPAEQTNLVAHELAKILLEAGVHPGAFGFLPGRGEIIGRLLVRHPDIDVICFTGSKAVGLEIIQEAAITRVGQKNVKRVIAEMGGKNAIIVDSDADFDEAIKGVLSSAFGYAGQKCSACSRLIIVGDAYEPFLERLAEAAADIKLGLASDPSSFFGPVIDRQSQERILRTIEAARARVPLLFQGSIPNTAGVGNFVPATIFRDVPTSDSLWREEVFGPVVAATQASNFEHALDLANDSQYALTGAVFSRSPKNIASATKEFKVGNLYLNRGCTGALVGRHPFGGFKMSGIGSKAGGPDYLLQFLEPRLVCENTMRRGFAPTA